MNERADRLIADLERRIAIRTDLADDAERRGDHKLATLTRIRRDGLIEDVALVRSALPAIIAEARHVEPDRAAVFGDGEYGYDNPGLACADCITNLHHEGGDNLAVPGYAYCEDHIAARGALADMDLRREMHA